MKVYRPHIEQRALQRGISLDQIEPIWRHEYGDGWWDANTLHPAYPRARPGLGDMVKSALSAVGITEERVTKAIGKPCGCGQRAAKLNELGHKYLGLPPGQTG
jgi:hypothetical protein